MQPIPSEIVTRWSPMWAENCNPARPWWRSTSLGWRRVDGRYLTEFLLDMNDVQAEALAAAMQPREDGKPLSTADELAMLAFFDAAYPLSVPPPMVGQVWLITYPNVSDIYEEQVAYIENGIAYRLYPQTSVGGPARLSRYDQWPPLGGMLVAGPTPWGRDVPWTGVKP